MRSLFFLPSPGLDVSTNLDQWIETHCLDADVFVLVISAEATIAGAVSVTLHRKSDLSSVGFSGEEILTYGS